MISLYCTLQHTLRWRPLSWCNHYVHVFHHQLWSWLVGFAAVTLGWCWCRLTHGVHLERHVNHAMVCIDIGTDFGEILSQNFDGLIKSIKHWSTPDFWELPLKEDIDCVHNMESVWIRHVAVLLGEGFSKIDALVKMALTILLLQRSFIFTVKILGVLPWAGRKTLELTFE